jgi:uncharacterized protein (TIGR00255 family)
MAWYHIMSMTGFGRAQRETSRGQFTVEVRTVNNRFQDINISLPREFNILEVPMRTLLKQEIPRGKIDCRVWFVPSEQHQPQVQINAGLAGQYVTKLRGLEEVGATGGISMDLLTKLPGVVELLPAEIDEQVMWRYLRGVVEQALDSLNRERVREGNALAEQLIGLGGELRALAARVTDKKDAVLLRFRERLNARLAELEAQTKTPLEPGKLENEVALFADRCDITEELVRLTAHLDRYESMINVDENQPIGKNLDFLVQEFMREINTICSKSRDTEITAPALEMKSIVERIREQVQNIQ